MLQIFSDRNSSSGRDFLFSFYDVSLQLRFFRIRFKVSFHLGCSERETSMAMWINRDPGQFYLTQSRFHSYKLLRCEKKRIYGNLSLIVRVSLIFLQGCLFFPSDKIML